MALPKEPRQKMINLMYLVLTALLALNVSAEILNAFKTVENSLKTTNTTIAASTKTIMESFEDKKTDPQTKAKAEIWAPQAAQAVVLTNDLNNYIESLKKQILTEAGFDPVKNGDSTFKEDNQDIATRIMVEQGKGKELRTRLEQYKNAMMKINDSLGKQIEERLKQIDLSLPPTKNKANDSWEAAYFRMVPTVAATTMLTKFQNDIKTAENRVVSLFHEQVGAVKVRFNKFAAIVGQNSNYLMPDQELEIRAGIGAFSTDAKPTINIAGTNYPIDADGIATFKTKASGNGERSVPIVINYFDQDGNPQTIRQEVKYTVGQSSAAIALPEMNVLYIGYPNKIEVSGGGVGAEKINIVASGGGASISKTANGKWTVNVSQQTDNCVITASAEGKTIGALTFRVRNMPEPIATVGGQKSGAYVNASTLAAQSGVGAFIENFPLNLKYSVTSFEIVTNDPETGDLIREKINGNAFNPRSKTIMRNLRSGDIITIEDIQCTGPDGRRRKLPSLLYNIN
ncbi:MAG TPA: gliding motility protein GldM [Flavisolibacter sp.]